MDTIHSAQIQEPPCPTPYLAVEGVDGRFMEHGGQHQILEDREPPRVARLIIGFEALFGVVVWWCGLVLLVLFMLGGRVSVCLYVALY